MAVEVPPGMLVTTQIAREDVEWEYVQQKLTEVEVRSRQLK
jgi:hypothetical protein